MTAMNDPSDGVPQALIPHVHLISSFRYPILAQVNIETVVEYLLQAPKITKEMAPMTWTYLDAPANGSMFLVWQPLTKLATHSASDGYVYADPESAFSSEMKGYTVEMYIHRSGYHPPNETIATHCRRRYRLTASKNPNNPAPDPSLWIIHYSAADPQNCIPSNRIAVPPPVQQVMSARRYIQSKGQLIRKDFMLMDRNNWPTLNMPGEQAAGSFQQAQAFSPAGQTGRAQPYFQPPPQIGPPAKRPRQTPPNHPLASATAPAVPLIPEISVEDEEDTSRGDLLDHLTPREISTVRYTQHHEWLEEVFSSPYATSQIIPVDLGLGLKGELEDLTKGIFDAPTADSARQDSVFGLKGTLEDGKAEEFSKRTADRLEQLNLEMEKMKKKHAKRMERLSRGAIFKIAEKRLRNAVEESGTEIWRIEGHVEAHGEDGHDNGLRSLKPKENFEKIVHEVEASLGGHIKAVQDTVMVQKGGLEERPPPTPKAPTPANGSTNANGIQGDVDMSNSEGLPDQYGARSTPGAMATPNPTISHPTEPTGPTKGTSDEPPAIEQGEKNEEKPEPHAQDESIPQMSDMDVDVEMAGVPDDHQSGENEQTSGINVESKEKSPEHQDQPHDQPPINQNEEQQPQPEDPKTDPLSAFDNTAGDALQGLIPSATAQNSGIDTTDFGDFGNLDAAGDMGGYGEDDDLGLDLDNSAFGEAFHGTEGHGGDDDMS
ncbi:MAG: hypothetical protein M1819_002415 [Sarea resinae]|nr:MAG: hypothetical protein M1819_002415 [Sarea resinae]